MTLRLPANPHDWLHPEHIDRAVQYLLELAANHDDAPLSDLADDALGTLERCRHVTLRYSERLIETDCEYAGRYRWEPPIIEVSKSRSRARDAFTALHEYSHHLQKTDATWALDVLSVLPEFTRHQLEEAVANTFASRVLIPDAVIDELHTGTITTSLLTGLRTRTAASRHAIIRRVAALATTPTLLVVTDYRGDVVAAASSDPDLFTHRTVPISPTSPGSHKPSRPAASTARTEAGVQYSTATHVAT